MGDVGHDTTDVAPPRVVGPTFAPGALIAGRYRLESRLGAGGGGTVWRCTDEKLASTVALKIIGSEGELERWRREVAMARRIAHRNVCRVHDLGETDDVRFVTMELVDGVGLRAAIAAGIAIDRARDLFAQIVSGVAAIHAAGVVHRDLKPDNIVVASDGRAVIVDFGLAREPGQRAANDAMLTREGTVIGTPRYMAPEQAAGEHVDARADVWALGLIGHELATGALPAGGVVAAIPAWPAIAPVLRRCLAVEPDERFRDARELEGALIRTRRQPRRYAIAGGLAAIAGVTVFALAGGEPTPAPLGTVTVGTLATPEAFSVALAPDAKEYAYTTAAGRLFVDAIAGGRATEWKLPAITYRIDDRDRELALVTTWVIGWLADRSVAVIGTTEAGTWHLVRVHADGRHTVLYSTTERFTATASGELCAIGVHENAVYRVDIARPEELEEIATLGRGETVMALAISPDGARVAVARLPPGDADAQIQVMSPRGERVELVWRGRVANDIDGGIAWLDADRLAFIRRGETATLLAHDLRTKQTTVRYEWPRGEYVGIGSGARGELVFLGGRVTPRVVAGDARARELALLHDPATTARFPAGWTADGRLVFSLRDASGAAQVVRAKPGEAPVPWPGLTDEVPSSLVGTDVIVHRTVGPTTIIERVDPSGGRFELRRVPAVDARYLVRCAGDRAAPCFLEEAQAGHVSWRAFDPATGNVGRVLHKRPRRERHMQTAALSPDGTTLAIVEGASELFLVDIATGTVRTLDAGAGAELQTVGFAADGSLWTSAMGYRGAFFSLLVFGVRDGRLATEPTALASEALRFFWRPMPSPDGAQVAAHVLDFDLSIVRVSGA